MLAQALIGIKRDGGTLSPSQIQSFVQGLVDERWSEGQVAAMAMAILLKGMTRGECVALTQAMTRSGQVLDWADAGLTGPVLDKLQSLPGYDIAPPREQLLRVLCEAGCAIVGASAELAPARPLRPRVGALRRARRLPGRARGCPVIETLLPTA